MAGTGKTVIQPKQYQKTYNFEVPCEGAKVLPIVLDFATFAEVDIDLLQFEQDSQLSMVQTVFIDNSVSAAAMVLVIDPAGINQTIVANGNTQGYYPILAPNPTLLQFFSQSGVAQRIQLVNVPIAGVVWPATHP